MLNQGYAVTLRSRAWLEKLGTLIYGIKTSAWKPLRLLALQASLNPQSLQAHHSLASASTSPCRKILSMYCNESLSTSHLLSWLYTEGRGILSLFKDYWIWVWVDTETQKLEVSSWSHIILGALPRAHWRWLPIRLTGEKHPAWAPNKAPFLNCFNVFLVVSGIYQVTSILEEWGVGTPSQGCLFQVGFNFPVDRTGMKFHTT